MSEKIDLVYDLVSRIDERQRQKSESDAARHATEDMWRIGVDTKLEEHTQMHKDAHTKFERMETPDKAWKWLKTKTGKVGLGVSGVTSFAYMIYRMFS